MTALVASGIGLLVIDQWSKRAVGLLSPRPCIYASHYLQLRPVLNLNRVYRSRAARSGLVVLWLFALASALILHGKGLWFQSRISQIGLGLAFGGALGNLLDILRHHSIVDFIDLRWWPVFNVADLGIVGGLLLAFWL